MAGRHPAPVGARNRTFKVTDEEYDFLKFTLSHYRKNITPLALEIKSLEKELNDLSHLAEDK